MWSTYRLYPCGGINPFNSPSIDDCFRQTPNNPPLLTYGYPYGEPYNGYVSPAPDITINQESYKYDSLSDCWGMEISNNKGKVKFQPLTGGFILNRIFKNNSLKNNLRFVIIEYTTKGKTYNALVPSDDYIKESFHKYLKEIFRYPGCTKGKFNELVAFLLQSVPTQDILMHPHQGWNETENGGVAFASYPQQLYIPSSLISPSVKRRKLSPLVHSKEEIIQNWLNIYAKHPSLQFIGCYHIGSLIQYFLRKFGIIIHQYLIAEPSEGLEEDKLKAMLATNDILNFPVPTLSSGEDKILAEQELVFDGIALITDDCFADEEKKILSGIKTLTKAVREDVLNDEKGNGLTAVISKNAAYVATRLAPENVIIINTDGVEVATDADTIKDVTGEMATLVINTISLNISEINTWNSNVISSIHKKASEDIHGASRDTLTMLYYVLGFFRKYLGFHMFNDESLECFIQTVDCKSDRVMNACEAIEREYYLILSRMVRSKSIIPVLKHRGMIFDNDGKSFLVDGNRLYIPIEIIETIRTQMTTTHSLESLMRALRQTKVLESTDGNTHPIEVHDSTGQHQRLYMYDVSAEILDSDVLYKIRNIANEEFLLDESEVPKKDFFTILRDVEGRVAGKLICFKDAENGHTYITGQSGWGKTYLLSQLIAKRFNLGNRVVVFDSSDSFSYEALCHNLSKRFVDTYITIHDLDKDGIPVDLFNIESFASLPTKKKLLLGIIQAGIGELSAPQSNALRTLLSNVITELDGNERITCDSIINKLKGINVEFFTPENVKDYLEPFLDEMEAYDYKLSAINESDRYKCKSILHRLNGGGRNDGEATLNSLLNRIEPLFEDIEEYGISDKSWGQFLGSSNNIVVIRTNSAYTESGNQVIDMLLATLYNYQHNNPQIALDVFIDELQNQNFSKTGPIRKVMKEGRKIHISFFGATQDCYPRNTELGSVMGKAGTQIFLRPSSNSANIVAAELRFSKAEMELFDSMMRGDIIVKANLFSKELGRNVPTTLSGHVDDYPKIPDNYYGNAL
ncbi:type IV secretion system DNA-binding domain-containing protein [Ruminococcus sp. XPD3002]|uniref:type IV secretion system DNA-binding domain-containing protein n=1 Tax=Ruminococcus sp. XPD3002 TaxID=1452269 RepID=UPI00091439D6|nr:hypothetical protein SAMN04487832_12620 [Ruminococcus flavefaciens]